MPIILTWCLVVASALAIGSLYIPLQMTGTDITVAQSFKILVGLDIEGERAVFGSLFWSMHTTFLPMVTCTAIMYLGKIVVIIVEKFFGKGASVASPYGFLAAFIGAIAVISKTLGESLPLIYLPPTFFRSCASCKTSQ